MSTASPTNLPPRTPHAPPYIGDSDTDVFRFIDNLANQVARRGAAAYGLTADQLAALTAARDAYQPLLAISKSNQRTAPGIVAKNEARDAADHLARTIAQQIKHNPHVSHALRVDAGVPPGDGERVRSRGVPRTTPQITARLDTKPRLVPRIEIRFHDASLASTRMPREAGITHLVLSAELAPDGMLTERRSALRPIAYLTRTPSRITMDHDVLRLFDLDRCATDFICVQGLFIGRWLTNRGHLGPLGNAAYVSMPLRKAAVRAWRNAADRDEHVNGDAADAGDAPAPLPRAA
jgi:hypothetical protein